MTSEEAAWLAGLLEGEGCFWLGRQRGTRKREITVKLKMTDRDVVERASVLMGCPRVEMEIDKRPRKSATYVARVHGAAAARLMLAVRPYMGERRGGKIDECLAARPDL